MDSVSLLKKTSVIERNTRGSSSETQENGIYGTKIEGDEESEKERLEKLEILRTQGLISEDEYQQAVSKG